jgi:hypothetical protein
MFAPSRVAVSVLAAAAALLLFLQPWSSQDLASIARLEPLPVRITREVPEARSFDAERLQLLSSYRDGDYASVLAHASAALTLRPGDGEITIYAASAEALSGEVDLAALRLDALLIDTDQPAQLLREARWQRAQLALLDDDAQRARVELEILVREDGIRQQDARLQLERL